MKCIVWCIEVIAPDSCGDNKTRNYICNFPKQSLIVQYLLCKYTLFTNKSLNVYVSFMFVL